MAERGRRSQRREHAIRGKSIATVDPGLGVIEGGEVLIEDEVILAVGRDLGVDLAGLLDKLETTAGRVDVAIANREARMVPPTPSRWPVSRREYSTTWGADRSLLRCRQRFLARKPER